MLLDLITEFEHTGAAIPCRANDPELFFAERPEDVERLVGAPLETGAPNGVYGVAFSPDGEWLASANSNSTIQLWNIALLRHPYVALCADVGPPTRQDWAKYAPGEPQPRICT